MNTFQPARRRSLRQEFRDSYRAGPRAWHLAMVVCCAVAFPLLGWLAFTVAMFFVLPALGGALLGRLVGSYRDARTLRSLQADLALRPCPPKIQRL